MLALSKYHGCGNDFLILMDQRISVEAKSRLVCQLCDRHTGIGADGCMFVHTHPLEMEFYNCDGSKAEMCGNGIRCFAKYVYDEQICLAQDYTVKTPAGEMKVHVDQFEPFLVSVHFPKPSLDPKRIRCREKQILWNYPITIDGKNYRIDTCFIGTIHTIVYVLDAFESSNIALGEKLHAYPLFLAQTNVNFVQVVDQSHIRLRTYERGVGISLACGSGCCAAVWDAWKRGLVKRKVEVLLPKGSLFIEIQEDETVIMQGGANRIMKGMAWCI